MKKTFFLLLVIVAAQSCSHLYVLPHKTYKQAFASDTTKTPTPPKKG